MGIGQTAVIVEDLEEAIKDYNETFGLNFTVVEIPEINCRVATSDGGIVLATQLDSSTGESPVKRFWNGGLAAVELRVDDLEEARRRLEERGVETVYYLETKGGLKEYYMAPFHGVPLTIFQMDQESWVEAIVGDDHDSSQLDYELTWHADPNASEAATAAS
jgi:catechol 2,3-dioxygenase-like lactoylglutathione lyase family enzyme